MKQQEKAKCLLEIPNAKIIVLQGTTRNMITIHYVFMREFNFKRIGSSKNLSFCLLSYGGYLKVTNTGEALEEKTNTIFVNQRLIKQTLVMKVNERN